MIQTGKRQPARWMPLGRQALVLLALDHTWSRLDAAWPFNLIAVAGANQRKLSWIQHMCTPQWADQDAPQLI